MSVRKVDSNRHDTNRNQEWWPAEEDIGRVLVSETHYHAFSNIEKHIPTDDYVHEVPSKKSVSTDSCAKFPQRPRTGEAITEVSWPLLVGLCTYKPANIERV